MASEQASQFVGADELRLQMLTDWCTADHPRLGRLQHGTGISSLAT